MPPVRRRIGYESEIYIYLYLTLQGQYKCVGPGPSQVCSLDLLASVNIDVASQSDQFLRCRSSAVLIQYIKSVKHMPVWVST